MNTINKNFIGIFTLILILATIASAVPANPSPYNLTQPDGFTFQAKQIGDEYSSRFETLDGYTIVQDADGYWAYSKINGTELTLTQNKVGNANIENLDIEKHVFSKRVVNEGTINTSVRTGSKAKTLAIKTTGTTKAVVILIGFTDKQASPTHTSSYYNNLLFSTSSGAKSLTDYYKEVSYNQLNIVGAASPQWYTSSHTMSYYGADPSNGEHDTANTRRSSLAEEAISLADTDIDFSQYDGNSDGVVDNVIIIHAGDDQSSSGVSTDIWSHKGYLNIPVDGVKITGYTMLAESSPLGTFAHEFGHDIGLSDLYNTETGEGVVQEWELMDFGSWNNNGNTPSHPSAWSKIQLGWITPINVTTQTTVNVPQLESNQYNSVYKISSSNMPSSEYFLLENRQKTGYDSYLPDDGIVIWHIDETQGSFFYNDVNNGFVKRVAVEDASSSIPFLKGAAYSSNDIETVFSPTSSPNSNSNEEFSTGISIYNIGSSGSSMDVSFSKSAQSALLVSVNPSILYVGTNTPYTTTVTSNGTPVSGATVTLSGLTSGTATTGSTGQLIWSLIGGATYIQAGNITVTVNKNGYSSATTTIYVMQPGPALTTITVSPSTASVIVGNTQTFIASPKDQYGNSISAIVIWGSSNPMAGTIDYYTGVFTAISAGTTTITASSGSVSNTTTATVIGQNATGYDANGDGKIEKSEALKAVSDYFNNIITKQEAIEVVAAYFRS